MFALNPFFYDFLLCSWVVFGCCVQFYIFHIVVVSSCCPVGYVCLKLFFICCQRCVFVVRGIRCVWLFQFVFLTVSRLIEGCFVKSILELFQMQVA